MGQFFFFFFFFLVSKWKFIKVGGAWVRPKLLHKLNFIVYSVGMAMTIAHCTVYSDFMQHFSDSFFYRIIEFM